MIYFGPAGNSQRFYDEGMKSSAQAPAWIASLGLNAYEYSGGRGVTLSEPSARAIGEAAKASGIAVSIHAPYYINFCSDEPDKSEKSTDYLYAAAQAVHWMGGRRVVFHIGSPGKQRREEAAVRAHEAIRRARARLDEAELSHILLCPETMGRPSQFGTLEEVLTLCRADERMIPTLDFGHLHAAAGGALLSSEDFERVLISMIDRLGHERARAFHAHFSRIEFTAKGEKRHRTFADEDFGPDFNHLAPMLLRYDLEPTMICESAGPQADDALAMKEIYWGLAGAR